MTSRKLKLFTSTAIEWGQKPYHTSCNNNKIANVCWGPTLCQDHAKSLSYATSHISKAEQKLKAIWDGGELGVCGEVVDKGAAHTYSYHLGRSVFKNRNKNSTESFSFLDTNFRWEFVGYPRNLEHAGTLKRRPYITYSQGAISWTDGRKQERQTESGKEKNSLGPSRGYNSLGISW